MKLLKPTLREQIALFRHGIIGDLLVRDLKKGELKAELEERAALKYRPPGQEKTRKYDFKTLQRWYYDAKEDPIAGLMPESRSRGNALVLDEEQKTLFLDMRVEHPSASAEMLLSEAERDGIVKKGELALSTLRRLYRSADLPRQSKRKSDRRQDVQRRSWQAQNPGDLWHADVCHLVQANDQGQPQRILVHGFLDDASRYCLTLMPRLQEREQDMLEVFCGVLLQHPAPRALYLDNGACYRGEALALLCRRLGIHLVHAKPYSPEARGKMERFWRTMRQRCSDYLLPTATLHDIGQALWAWLDKDYHLHPHAGLLGETPRRRYLEGLTLLAAPLTPKQLAAALEVTERRHVRQNGTFSIDKTTYEVSGRHLAGKEITIIVDALTEKPLRVTYQEHPVPFGICDPIANSQRRILLRGQTEKSDPTPKTHDIFNPIAALLQKAREADHE